MTQRFVKFASLFAVVAMFLGLMVTGCSEGNNTPANPEDVAGRMTVVVTRDLTASKGELKDIDNMKLYFDNLSEESDLATEASFADPNSGLTGVDYWTEVGDSISMTVNFNVNEVAAGYNTLLIKAYKGTTLVSMFMQEIPTIKAGVNEPVAVDEEDFIEPFTAMAVSVSAYDKETGKGIPEATKVIEILLSNDNANYVTRRFVAPGAQGSEDDEWVENEDGTISMFFTLSNDEVAQGNDYMTIFARQADGTLVGTCSDEITIEKNDFNYYDFTDAEFAISDALDINVKWNEACTADTTVMTVCFYDSTDKELLYQQNFCSADSGIEGMPYWLKDGDSGANILIASSNLTEVQYAAYVKCLEKSPARVRVYCFNNDGFTGLWHIDQNIVKGINLVECTDPENFVAAEDMEIRLIFGCVAEGKGLVVNEGESEDADLKVYVAYSFGEIEYGFDMDIDPEDTIEFTYDEQKTSDYVKVEKDAAGGYKIYGLKATKDAPVEIEATLVNSLVKVDPGTISVNVVGK